MKRTILTFVTAAALLAGSVDGRTGAQEGPVPDIVIEAHGSWQLACDGTRAACRVVQELQRAEDKAVLARVTLFKPESGEGKVVLRSLTPLGAKLRRGAVLQIDGTDAVKMPFLTCFSRGCLAETPLSPVLELALRGGKKIAVAVIAEDTGKTFRFELPLDGFGPAVDRLRGG